MIQSSQTKAQQQIQCESRMKRRENMKSCRKTIGIAAALLSIAVICVTFFQVTSAKASDKLVIRLAHNQAAGSEIADSIALISDITAEDASMNMEAQIYPSGVLGTEKDIIEMVKAGILDMAKVSRQPCLPGQWRFPPVAGRMDRPWLRLWAWWWPLRPWCRWQRPWDPPFCGERCRGRR